MGTNQTPPGGSSVAKLKDSLKRKVAYYGGQTRSLDARIHYGALDALLLLVGRLREGDKVDENTARIITLKLECV